MDIDQGRLQYARQLFRPNGKNVVLLTTFEGLGAELRNRTQAFEHIGRLSQAMQRTFDRDLVLANAFSYVSQRLTEVFARLRFVAWLRDKQEYEINSDTSALASDPNDQMWRLSMGFAVKDFHGDVASLMDAIAPVIIQSHGNLRRTNRNFLPGWRDIQSGSTSVYRRNLAEDLKDVIDGTESWWTTIKAIRNLLLHRDHQRIIFGDYRDGILFQIYDSSQSPQIILPDVLHKPGHFVVDFDLYSAFVVASLVTLLNDLGNTIALQRGFSPDDVSGMNIRLVDRFNLEAIDRLIESMLPNLKTGPSST